MVWRNVKNVVIGMLIFSMLVAAGCSGPDKVTGFVTVDLPKSTIGDGEKTIIKVDGTNTGEVRAKVELKVIPEDTKMVRVYYPESLEFVLQPGENTGHKIVSIQGFSNYSSTTYRLKIQLVYKDSSGGNVVLDEKIKEITVKK